MFFTMNNVSLYYEKYGNSKESILILPGWGNTRSTFYNIINYLKDTYSIYIIDYPGFGNSPFPMDNLNIYDYAKLIKELIQKLKLKSPIIIAHSFGGRIVSLLAGYYKLQIKKIILFDVAGIKRKKKIKIFIKEKIYKILKRCCIVLPKRRRIKYLQKLLMIFGSTDYKSIPLSMRKTFQNVVKEDLKKYYKKISSEVLIIWGEKDLDTPLKDAFYLKKKIDNSSLIIYPNSKHFSYLDYPDLTNIIISEFLK